MKQSLFHVLPNNFALKVGGIVEAKYRQDRYVLIYRRVYRNGGIGFTEWTRGGVKSGSMESNVRREIKEETGLRVKVTRPLIVNIYQAPKIKYTDCQIYFVCRPIKYINIKKVWHHKDIDPEKKGKRCYECRFIKIQDLKPSDFHHGQDFLVRYYLKTIKK